jgi:hypothetical protein
VDRARVGVGQGAVALVEPEEEQVHSGGLVRGHDGVHAWLDAGEVSPSLPDQ